MSRFTARDDLLHDVSGSGAHARESLVFTAPILDEELLLFCYLWREQGTRWGRFVSVAGPDMGRPEFLSLESDTTFTGADLDDCSVGGLRLRQPEPLHSAELAFDGDGLIFQVRFEGVHEPFSWHDNPSGCPRWAADDRYEQSCRTSGALTLGERRVEFASAGHRDHSWGARDWRPLQHWKWMNATAEDRSLHVMIMFVKGQVLVNGYLNVDGELSPVVVAEATAELDDQMVHRGVSGRFTDQLGRQMSLECSFAAGWSMPIRHLVLNEIGMRATLDGRPAVAHVELGWPSEYLRAMAEA